MQHVTCARRSWRATDARRRANVLLFTQGSCCRRVLQQAIELDGDDKSAFRESAVAVLRMCRSRAPRHVPLILLRITRFTSQV